MSREGVVICNGTFEYSLCICIYVYRDRDLVSCKEPEDHVMTRTPTSSTLQRLCISLTLHPKKEIHLLTSNFLFPSNF